MSDERLRFVTAAALVTGALLGMAGTFAPSAQIRSLAWGTDGTALVLASALLTVHHLRHGRERSAAGFLVFHGAIGPAAARRLSWPSPCSAGPGRTSGHDRRSRERGTRRSNVRDPARKPRRCEPGLSDDRPRDPRRRYCPALSPRAT